MSQEVSIRQAAEILGVSARTVRRRIKQRKLPHKMLLGKYGWEYLVIVPSPGRSQVGRGGRRPGAGAPEGNLNRLTHGRQSKQVRRAIENALADPEGQLIIEDLVRRYGSGEGQA